MRELAEGLWPLDGLLAGFAASLPGGREHAPS